MVNIKCPLARLVEHIIGDIAFPHHNVVDFKVELRGLSLHLRLECIDDKLHVGRAIWVGTSDVTMQPYDFAIGDNNATIGNETLHAYTSRQLVDMKQGLVLLVGNVDCLQYHLIERLYGKAAYRDVSLQRVAQLVFNNALYSLLHHRNAQQDIQQGIHSHNSDYGSHHNGAHNVVAIPYCFVHSSTHVFFIEATRRTPLSTAAQQRRWACASRHVATSSHCPPWDRRAGTTA